MNYKQIQAIFFFTLLVVVGVLLFFLLRSYLVILAAALALAVLFRPVFHWFRSRASTGRGAAALFVTLVMFFVVALPLTGLTVLLGYEIGETYTKLIGFIDAQRAGTTGESSRVLRLLGDTLRNQAANGEGIGAVVSAVSRSALNVFSGVTDVFLGVFLFFIAFYYFMKDGHTFRKKLFGMSPLSDISETKIYHTVLTAINAVIRGSVIVAVVQGTIAGVGFWIFGVGAPVLLGALTMFAALIPMLGTSLVLVPVIAYLFVKGTLAAGIGLLIWGGVAVGLVDNILKPKLIEQRMKAHPLLILLSILGGLQLFGFLGVLLGPLVLAVAWALIEIYREEYHSYLGAAFESENSSEHE